MIIDKTEDGYRLKKRFKKQALYFFITLEEAIQLSERLDKDFEHDAKVCEQEYSEQPPNEAMRNYEREPRT